MVREKKEDARKYARRTKALIREEECLVEIRKTYVHQGKGSKPEWRVYKKTIDLELLWDEFDKAYRMVPRIGTKLIGAVLWNPGADSWDCWEFPLHPDKEKKLLMDRFDREAKLYLQEVHEGDFFCFTMKGAIAWMDRLLCRETKRKWKNLKLRA